MRAEILAEVTRRLPFYSS